MLKLVIVEDEDIIREGLVSFTDWEKMGYEVVGEADNGKKGLEVIRNTKPDVVMTDIRMPVKDGLEMLKELRNDDFEGSVVILSGYEDFEYARKAIKMGAFEYLLKPLDIDQLQEVMKKVYEELSEKKESRKNMTL